MFCTRKIVSILTGFAFLFSSAPLPALPAQPHWNAFAQDNVPPYPLAQKDAVQQRCDQLAEDPDDPTKSGPGMPVDRINTSEAHSVCQQAAARPAWRARYQFLFGRVLEAERNWGKAAEWYEAAGDNGFADAYTNLGALYSHSQPPNYPEAANWYLKAVRHGSARGSLMLGWLYQTGKGVQRNPDEAVRLYADAGKRGQTDAMYRLGMIYEDGDGVPEDPVEAVKWYRMAVEQNDASAMNNLALLLATSKNARVRNPQEAIALATKAVAAANNPDYLDTLAAAYFAAGQTDKAVETEQKALAMSPGNDAYKESLQKYLGANGGR